jgi:hypoxanthine phosphoribosyltransferase
MQLWGFVASVLSLMLGFLSSPRLSRAFRALTKRKNWKDLEALVRSERVEALFAKSPPDVIIGLNAGIVPASILGWNHNIDTVYYFQVPYRETNRKAVQVIGPDASLENQDVLIVDDQIYTGEGLERLKEHLTTKLNVSPDRMTTLTLLFDSDYKGELPVDIRVAPVHGGIKEVAWSYGPARLPLYRQRHSTKAASINRLERAS